MSLKLLGSNSKRTSKGLSTGERKMLNNAKKDTY